MYMYTFQYKSQSTCVFMLKIHMLPESFFQYFLMSMINKLCAYKK